MNRSSYGHWAQWPRVVGVVSSLTAAGVSHGALLLGQWHLDEAPGSGVAVASAGGVNGILSGSADFALGGVAGNALRVSIDGNGLASMGDNFNFGHGDFSLVTWVRTEVANDQSANYMFLGKHRSTIVEGYILGMNPNPGGFGEPNRAWFYTADSGLGLSSTSSVNDGQWHQVVGVFQSGGFSEVYVDGAPAENSRGSGTFSMNDAPFLLGGIDFAGVPTSCFNGYLDEVQVYGSALTGSQIEFLFNHPAASVVPGLLADVNLDGSVNALDISFFVERLITGSYQPEADCNQDGEVNSLDISQFVRQIVGGGGQVVPEAGTAGVAVAAGVVTLLRRRGERLQAIGCELQAPNRRRKATGFSAGRSGLTGEGDNPPPPGAI